MIRFTLIRRIIAGLGCLLLAHALACSAALVFYTDGQGELVGFERADATEVVSAVQALAVVPTAAEFGEGFALSSGVLPGVQVQSVQTVGDTTTVRFSMDILGAGLDEARLTTIFKQVRATLWQFGVNTGIRLETEEGRLLSSYLPASEPVEPEAGAVAKPAPAGGKVNNLAGKNITLGPSHGRYWAGFWAWQRSDPCGFGEAVLEDVNSIRLIQFLYQYLVQDGATVHVARQLNEGDCCHGDTGLAWYKMCAQSWLRASGLPCSVWANSSGNCGADTAVNRSSDDIRARPKFADYRGSDIYIAHHTNAGGGGTANGTETWRDTAMEYPAHVANSLTLANKVQASVVNAIRDMYPGEGGWANRGVKDSAGGFGEIRIPNRPAILIELAFHDNCSRDAAYLTDNFFRSVAEWGLYRGVCEYFGTVPSWDKYSGEYVSDTIPATMNPGQSYSVSVTFRNRGVVWSETRAFRLGAVGDSDPFTGTTRQTITGEVKPGNTYTFNFTLTAPVTPGTYTTDWRMVRDGYAWFGPTLAKQVTVGSGGEIGHPAAWGPYNLTQARSIYYPANQATALRTGWYTTTPGTGAARTILKAADAAMATMPAAAMVSGSTFTVAYATAGTYSSLVDNPLNIYRIGQSWDAGTAVWNAPWADGGNYSSVGTSPQSVVYPADGTLYTFSPGANYNFPYGVLMKGEVESSISYRKAWKNSDPYPTLTVRYTTPPGTSNAVIRSWAYLGWYEQGAVGDRQLRIDTDQVAGSYGGVSVVESELAAAVGGVAYGNSYGVRQWAQGTFTNDLVNLNAAPFYNAVHENAVTYCQVYVKNSKGSDIAGAYLGIGSDDGCKVWWNGGVVGSDVVGRAVSADADFWGPITISNGWNRLLIKVENGGTGHGVYARFANADRTALTDRAHLSFYTTDSTAPSQPGSLGVAGVTSGVWQNSVSAPVFSWTSGVESQGSGEGVSGVRGQKYYYGLDPNGVPGVFQAGTSYAPGAQGDGAYYFKVQTVDGALNQSGPATFAFWYDGTAPGPVTGLGASSPGSSDTDWYNSSGDLTWQWTAAVDVTSGLDGYAIVQDQAGSTEPAALKTHGAGQVNYTLTGPQPSGEYWLHIRSVDTAGNWQLAANTAHRRIRIDSSSPTGVSLGFGTVTTESIEVLGSGTDAHSGINPATGYNYSRTGAADSGPTGATQVWSGLVANTEYSGFSVTVSDQAVPVANSAASGVQSCWTLSVPPTGSSVVADQGTVAVGSNVTWTAVNGFGAGQVEYYRYAWDNSPSHTWTDTEPQWAGGTVVTVPSAAGTWYLHVKGYNGAGVGNGSYAYAVTATAASGSVTELVSSENPSQAGANVTFTATVSAVPPAVGTPSGEVVFWANSQPFSTNVLSGGIASVSTADLPVGTNTIVAEYAGDNDFTGSSDSLAQVVTSLAPCSQTNAIVGIADNRDGTFTITFQGTPQAQYYVVDSADAVAPMSSWTALAGSTNTVTDPGGLWQITITNTAARRYYRSTAVMPCP